MFFNTVLLLAAGLFFTTFATGQSTRDSASYTTPEKGFYLKEIKPSLEKKHAGEKAQVFQLQTKNDREFPVRPGQFDAQWHNPPESQGATGTCWAYAATSFLESEIYRIHKKKVQLSEMYFVYMDYVDRTERYVETRGDTYFNHGSEANAVTRVLKKYGAIPFVDFPGKSKNDRFHTHGTMMKEMKQYLSTVKKNNAWNKEVVVATIKNIMNHYMGTPPEKFMANDILYTPETYAKDFLKIIPDNYYSFMSTRSKTFWQRGELVEPDNWWHANNYYNLPLPDYFELIDRSIDKGFTISICGDVSEPGHLAKKEVSLIPDFDIPSAYINQDARELRLHNQSTTDDHCLHLVGNMQLQGEKWYLIKDSGAGGFDGPNKGYRFFHEDYIRLKMMNILIHRDAARPELDQMIKK